MLAEGGLRLHPDTMRHFAEVQIRRAKHIRVAIWIATASVIVLALVLLLYR